MAGGRQEAMGVLNWPCDGVAIVHLSKGTGKAVVAQKLNELSKIDAVVAVACFSCPGLHCMMDRPIGARPKQQTPAAPCPGVGVGMIA